MSGQAAFFFLLPARQHGAKAENLEKACSGVKAKVETGKRQRRQRKRRKACFTSTFGSSTKSLRPREDLR